MAEDSVQHAKVDRKEGIVRQEAVDSRSHECIARRLAECRERCDLAVTLHKIRHKRRWLLRSFQFNGSRYESVHERGMDDRERERDEVVGQYHDELLAFDTHAIERTRMVTRYQSKDEALAGGE